MPISLLEPSATEKIFPPAPFFCRIAPPAVVFLAQACLFAPLAVRRLIDSDEGFYLYISKLAVTHGMLPYRDVFYQQMPLLPYLYGPWMKAFGFTWESGRLLSALLAALIGTLLFEAVRKTTRSHLLSVASVLLYATNLSVLLFFLTAKTYTLSTLFLFASMLLMASNDNRASCFLSGFALALSVQTRLFFAAAAIPFAVMIRRRKPPSRWLTCWNFSAGLILGMLPASVFFLLVPRQFLYDNLLYHAMRDPAGLIGDLGQKLAVARNLLISHGSFRPTQFFFLILGLPVSLVLWRKLDETGKLAALLAGAMCFASFLPTPTFAQYFCVTVPFLILCLIQGLSRSIQFFPQWGAHVRLAILVISVLSVVIILPSGAALFWQGRNVPGILAGTEAGDWTVMRAKKVAATIDSCTDAGFAVVCSWPGYLLTSSTKVYPKMENQFSMEFYHRQGAEGTVELRVMTEEELCRAIADPRVQTVVTGNCAHNWHDLYLQEARKNGYALFWNEGNVSVHVRQRVAPDD